MATPVTLTGSGFQQGATVTFGASSATNVVVQSATTLSATTPPLPAGAVSVVVTNPGSQPSAPASFTFMPVGSLPAPTISSMTPATDLPSGGKQFTIAGTNFLGGATVTIGGAAAVAPVTVSSVGTSITGTIPPGALGPAAVVVRNVDGQTASRTDLFSYGNGSPVISALSVEGAPLAGGTRVLIAGTGFSPSATVTFGGAASTSVVLDLAAGGLSVLVPASPVPAGAFGDAFVPLVVTNPDGQSGTFAKEFHYGPPPTIASVTPSGATPITPGDVITVTGADFSTSGIAPRAGLQVSVGGIVVVPTSASPGQIVFSAPKINNLLLPVVVTNFDKQSATSAQQLNFVP